MAEREAVYSSPITGKLITPSTAPGAYLITWSNITESDTAEAVYHPDYSEKSVDVELTGTTPVISIDGGNDPAATTPKLLKDLGGADLTFTGSGGVEGIQQNVGYVKPRQPTGTGDSVAKVMMLVTTIARR